MLVYVITWTLDALAITTLAGAGLTAAGADLGPDATTSENLRPIDYVLVAPGLPGVHAEIPEVSTSDHRPFVTRLRITS